MPTFLHQHLFAVVQPADQGWCDPELDLAKLGAFIGACKDKPLAEVLRRLKTAAGMSVEEQKEVGTCLLIAGPVRQRVHADSRFWL